MSIRWAVVVTVAIAISGGPSSASSQQPPPVPTLRAPPPLPLFGGLSQGGGQNRGCDEDVFCRLDAIDARLARIERALARGGGGSGGVSIAVGQYCNASYCSRMASDACITAGFGRGAPDEINNDESTPMLVRAVCFD